MVGRGGSGLNVYRIAMSGSLGGYDVLLEHDMADLVEALFDVGADMIEFRLTSEIWCSGKFSGMSFQGSIAVWICDNLRTISCGR